MKLTMRYRGLAVVASAFAVAACADNSTAPKSMISSLAGNHAARTIDASFLHSNNTQYRAQTVPYQSNRSGVATLTSRALLGKDGVTVLEVTTGALGAASAPGNISKLQEKALDSDKNVIWTRNFNGLTGPVQTRSFNGLPRHGFIQTQGNVRDIDPKRTDVVTITERVNARPDIGAIGINAPDRARPGQDFIVTASLQELNGDVGAFDDCVLYVDGTEASRINHQWIANGDAVNCDFRINIAAVGAHTLEVRSQNVAPGDWDMANNSASRTIEIVNPEVVLHGQLYANDYNYHYRNYSENSFTSLYPETYRSQYENTSDQRQSYASFNAYAYGSSGAGNLTSVNFSITSGGATVASISAANIGTNCTNFYADYGNSQLYVCSYDGYAYAQGWFNSGAATYYSYNFYVDQYPGYYYSYSDGPNSSTSSWGSGNVFAGNDVTLDLRAEGSNGGVITANASLTLSDWSQYNWYYYYNQPLTCTDYSDSWATQHNCYEYTQYQQYRSGYTYF